MALADATTPVIDQAKAAYLSAQALHDQRVDYDAASEFDSTQPVYNPRHIQPLLSEKDIEIRLTVLAALQTYVHSVVAITRGTNSPALDAASKSVGNSLSGLGNLLAPSIASALNLPTTPASTTETTVATTTGNTVSTTSSTSSTAADAITPEARNAISTAANALAQFFASRKIRKQLPEKIRAMDPNLQTLCHLRQRDIDVLQDQEKRDSDSLINRQTLFIRQSTALNPLQRREEIMKLPDLVRQQRTAQEQLVELQTSITRLSLAHHALATATASNSLKSLKNNMDDLKAAGSDLGKFYSSLPPD